MPPSTLSIFALLEDFVAKHPEDRVPVRALVDYLEEHGLLLLLLIFALFCAIPLPIPGIHIFLSMPLFYVTIQQALGWRKVWFPEAILVRTLPRSGFVALLERASPWFHRLEKYIHPRLTFLTDGIWYRVMGAIALFITCIIVIPLPLTNVVPSLAIACMALGALCHDGLTVLVGALCGFLWCLAWLVLFFYLGWVGMQVILVIA